MTTPNGATRTVLADGTVVTTAGSIVDLAGEGAARVAERDRAVAGEMAAHTNPVFNPKQPAIASPTSDTVGTKAAIDAIRAALIAVGITS